LVGKQIGGRTAVALAEVFVVAVAAEPDGAAASAPMATVAAAIAANTNIVSLFIVFLLFA
jgi:hypothetical protein